mmetsp:Transcript_17336/g.48304  ORF Transcript_17336/g.48304 Transcript_17336/m.48304 type:complete len:158 (-) Transcript_17336:221-694(-)
MEGKTENVSPVSETVLWKNRCQEELRKQRQWSSRHGYMLGSRTKQADTLDEFLSTLHTDSAKGVGTVYNMKSPRPRFAGGADATLGLRPRVRRNRNAVSVDSAADSIENFIEGYLKNTNIVARPLPKDLYQKPLLTSHRYGWGKNLEVFGPLKLSIR